MGVIPNIFDKQARVPFDKNMEYVFYNRRQDTPLLDLFSGKAKSTNAKEVRWVRNEILPRMYVETDLSTSSGVTSIAITTGTAATQSGEPIYDLGVGDIIRLDSELVRVTAMTEATAITARSGTTNGYVTLTVARGALGSTAATHASGYEEAFPVGNVYDVTASFNGAVNDPGLAYVDYMAYSKEAMHIDNFDMDISSDPGGTGINRTMYRTPIVQAVKMEGQLLWSLNTAPASSTAYGSFTGILSAAASTSVSYTASAFTRDNFEDVINEAENNGINPNVIVCGSVIGKALNNWYEGQVLKTTDDQYNLKRVKAWLPNITTSQEPLRIIRHKQLPSTHLIVMDSSKIKMHYLARPSITPMGADGSGYRGELGTKWCLQVACRGKMSKVTDLTNYA